MQIAPPDELLAQALGAPAIAAVAEPLSKADGDVYLVGGTVRDLILGRAFIDVDLAVDGDVEAVAVGLRGSPGAEARGGATRFGTLSVMRDGWRYDLARTRSERYARPGALPDVRPGDIGADLNRRDFTVNALALGLTGSRAGELIAVPHALEDLSTRRLAVMHERSFTDDPTRLLRLARYAARLGFEPASRTLQLAQQAAAVDAIDTVSGPRIGNELRLLATEADPVAAFATLRRLGLPWAIDGERTREALQVLPGDGRADLLVLGSMFGAEPSESVRPQLDRLGFAAGDREVIAEAATRSADLARRLAKAASNSEIARIIGSSATETVALASSHGARSQSLKWLQELRHASLEITGRDLIDGGLEEGPAIGEALARARAALLDGTAPDRQSQLQVALYSGE